MCDDNETLLIVICQLRTTRIEGFYHCGTLHKKKIVSLSESESFFQICDSDCSNKGCYYNVCGRNSSILKSFGCLLRHI